MRNCDFHVELRDGMCTTLAFDGDFIDHVGHSGLFILKIDEVLCTAQVTVVLLLNISLHRKVLTYYRVHNTLTYDSRVPFFIDNFPICGLTSFTKLQA